MAADLTASLVLKLQDELSGGLRKLQDQLEQLRGVAETIQMKGLNDAAEKAENLNGILGKTRALLSRVGDGFAGMGQRAGEAFGKIRGHMHAFQEASGNLMNSAFGAAAEGFAVIEPMKKYADYENIVRHIGITEGLSGAGLNARIATLEEFFRADAIRTGQSSESVAQAYQDLTQMGIHQDLDKIIQAHSRAATAYNTTAEALGPAVGALVKSLKIPADDLGATMAAMAQASKEGRFKIEDFSRELPGIAAQFGLWGMTGRKAADTAFAALETVMKGSSNPSQAATDLTQVLSYMASPFAARFFAKSGVNMHALLEKGVHSGDLLGATLDALSARFKGKDRVGFIQGFGALFHSHEAAKALSTLMQQREDFEALRTKLNGVDSGQVERDFISGFDAPAVQMRIMSELIEQITERLGQGFLPMLKYVNFALLDMNTFLKWATDNYPKLTGNVLFGVAAFLAFGAALAVIGAVVPLIVTGFGLVASVFAALSSLVLTLVAGFAAFGAAAYDIYAHWDRFRGYFVEMWEGVKQAFDAFLPFVTDVFMVGLGRALHGDAARRLDDGVLRVFTGLWDAVKQVFNDFVSWVDGWANGLASHIVKGIGSGFSALPGHIRDALLGGLLPAGLGSTVGSLLDLAKQKTQPPKASNDNGGAVGVNGRVDVHVHADPGTAVTAAQGTGAVNVQAPVSAPARGATVGRP